MTFDELLSLRQGEVVVFTDVDDSINTYNEYSVGDELIYLEYHPIRDCYNFLRYEDLQPPVIAHFSQDIYKYIERKKVVSRNNKLTDLGI